MFYLLPWITYVQIVNLNKKYPELEAHETLKREASANAILKHYVYIRSSLITVKRHAMVLSFFKS